MKKLIVIILPFIGVLLSLNVQAQEKAYLSEMYLKGTWIASCPIEVVDHATMQYSQLCSVVIDAAKKSNASVTDVEMTFKEDSIVLNRNGKIATVPYKRNKDTHAFSFKLNGKQYDFRVFIHEKERIIVDKEGFVMVLKRKE
jgi:hypothetical protein